MEKMIICTPVQQISENITIGTWEEVEMPEIKPFSFEETPQTQNENDRGK